MPQYDLFLLVVGPLVLVALTLLMRRTRFGLLVRAASENRVLAGALGIDEAQLFTAVFALGALLAGLAGALTLPREPANLGMDLAVIADAFVVTVLGGLGSIPGAFVAAIIIGVDEGAVHRRGTVTIAGMRDRDAEAHARRRIRRDGDRAAVRPARAARHAAATRRRRRPIAGRARAGRAGRRGAAPIAPARSSRSPLLLPFAGDEYALVLATDILIAALFAASLQLISGTAAWRRSAMPRTSASARTRARSAATHGYPFVASAGARAGRRGASRRWHSARCACGCPASTSRC